MNLLTKWISLLALATLVVILPLYAVQEPTRMVKAQEDLSVQQVEEGASLYIRYCAVCHGVNGEGVGATPPLNHPVLKTADAELLHTTISRAAHGTTMAAWHIQEGGALTDYQISELVTLIKMGDWDLVETMAIKINYEQPEIPVAELGEAYLHTEDEADPHRCVACHEDPLVHRDRFGVNCARCHSSIAWTPAYLTRHIFLLDHGGQGTVACTTCHAENYFTHTCYGCHDHTPELMEEVHVAEKIDDYAACANCHPTGQPDEGRLMMQTGALPADGSYSGLVSPVEITTPEQ